MICEPLHNSCRVAEISDSECNMLSPLDMSQFAEMLSTLIDVGVHKHFLCSALQFRPRYELFLGMIRDLMKEKHVGKGEEAWSRI